MPAYIRMELTPPPPDNRLATLRPREFVRDSDIVSPLSHRAEVPASYLDMTRASLCPPPTKSDATILDYHSRVMKTPGNEGDKIRIALPLSTVVKKFRSNNHKLERELRKDKAVIQAVKGALSDRRCKSRSFEEKYESDSKRLKGENMELKQTVEKLEKNDGVQTQRIVKLEIDSEVLKSDNEVLKSDSEILKSDNEILKSEITEQQLRRIRFMAVNLLNIFFDQFQKRSTRPILEGKGDDNTHSTSRYTRAAKSMSEVSFRMATGLGQAQWKLVLAYPELVESRNKAAHKTEFDFARLLCSPEKVNSPLYYTWAPFFDYCFEKTIEEMAAVAISKEAELIAILTGTG